jgi:hypothetical protein
LTLLASPPEPVTRLGTVQWYVPYTAIHPATAAAAPADAIWVDVSHGPYSYFTALLCWWDKALAAARAGQPHDIAILEHDVICRPDIIATFESCPEPWCTYSYAEMCCQDETGYSPCREAWRNQLGCTRFRSELIVAVPDAVRDIPRTPTAPRQGSWDWHNLCDGLAGEGVTDGALDRAGAMPPGSLRGHGYTQHWHTPHVRHHSETEHLRAGRNPDGTERTT